MNIRDQLESAKEILADYARRQSTFSLPIYRGTLYYWKRRVAILKRLAAKP